MTARLMIVLLYRGFATVLFLAALAAHNFVVLVLAYLLLSAAYGFDPERRRK